MNPNDIQFSELEKILASMPTTGVPYGGDAAPQTSVAPQLAEMQEKLESAENQVEVLTNTVEILRRELVANSVDFQNQLNDLKTAFQEISHATR